MRINFFSILLVLLITVSTGKILYLFDRVVAKTGGGNSNIHNIFTVKAANAEEEISSSDQSNIVNDDEATPDKELQKSLKEQYESNILDQGFNEYEIEVLQNLSKRRKELEAYNKKLNNKESILESTEKKLSVKMEELKKMEKRINDLMDSLDAKSSTRIKSLAKIYESMRPAEAAKIFNELEMPVLLEIVRNMRESKVAPIIAQMNSHKAKEVSLEFAKINESIDDIKNRNN